MDLRGQLTHSKLYLMFPLGYVKASEPLTMRELSGRAFHIQFPLLAIPNTFLHWKFQHQSFICQFHTNYQSLHFPITIETNPSKQFL
jgi:hypothetical protein